MITPLCHRGTRVGPSNLGTRSSRLGNSKDISGPRGIADNSQEAANLLMSLSRIAFQECSTAANVMSPAPSLPKVHKKADANKKELPTPSQSDLQGSTKKLLISIPATTSTSRTVTRHHVTRSRINSVGSIEDVPTTPPVPLFAKEEAACVTPTPPRDRVVTDTKPITSTEHSKPLSLPPLLADSPACVTTSSRAVPYTPKRSKHLVGHRLPPGKQVRSILRKKFSWKSFPELENYLIEHRDQYLSCSSSLNYTKTQKLYNNHLTQGLLDVAAEHGYVFEGFTFPAVRDRIRCFYKSYVQATKKKKRQQQRRAR